MRGEQDPSRGGQTASNGTPVPVSPERAESPGEQGSGGPEQGPTTLFAAKQPERLRAGVPPPSQEADIFTLEAQLQAERARADAAEAELRRRREANAARQRRYRERHREAYNAREAARMRERRAGGRHQPPTHS